jgi:hypothetical protein
MFRITVRSTNDQKETTIILYFIFTQLGVNLIKLLSAYLGA